MTLRRIGLFAPHVHLATLVMEVSTRTVKLPFCWRCHINQIVPAMRVWIPVIAIVVLVAGGLYLTVKDFPEYGLPSLFLALVGLILVSKSERRRMAEIPIKVYYEDGMFQYYAWDGPLYEFLKSIRSTPPDSDHA